MDMMGKAMFSHHVGKLKEDFGFKDEEKETSNYDPEKEAEEEAQLAEQRQRRKEAQGKKQAERAANRNKIREKYGLKQNKQDQQLVSQHATVSSSETKPSKDNSSLTRSTSSQDKKDDKCMVM